MKKPSPGLRSDLSVHEVVSPCVAEPFARLTPLVDKAIQERALELIADAVSHAIVYFDLNERYVFSNRHYESYYGRKRSEILGKTLQEVIGSKSYGKIESHVKAALQGEIVSFETQIEHDTIGPMVISATFVPDKDEFGKVRGFAAISEDISARRRIESDLRQNQESLRFALQSARMGTWEIDLSTGKVGCSREVLELWGVCPEEVQNNRSFFQNKVHPDDVEKVNFSIEESIRQGTIFELEYRIVPTSGQVRWVMSRGRCTYNEKSKSPSKFSGVVFDITHRKEDQAALHSTEVKFESLVNSIPQIVWMSEPDGRGSFFNQQWYDYSGIPRGSLLDEINFASIHPDDQSYAQNRLDQSLRTEDPFDMELRIRRHDGIYRWFLVRALALRDGGDRIFKWLGTMTDIHAQKTTELRALAIQNLSAFLLRADTRDEVVDAILSQGRRALGADAVTICRKDARSRTLKVVRSAGYDESVYEKFLEISIDDDFPAAAAVREGKIKYFHDKNSWTSDQPNTHLTSQFAARVVIPLSQGSEIVGVVVFSFHDPQEFTRTYQSEVQVIADEFSQAIARAQLQEEQASYSAKVEELQLITSELSKSPTEAEVLSVIQNRVFSTFHASSGMMYRLSHDGKSLERLVSKGYLSEFQKKLTPIRFEEEQLFYFVFNSAEPIFLENPEEIGSRFPSLPFTQGGRTPQAMAILPMILNKKKLGLIHFTYEKQRKFPENTKRLMLTLGAHCAEALERARLYDLSEKAVKARDNMIAISAHELLTPVSGLKIQMQIFKKKLEQGIDLSRESLIKIARQTDNNLSRLSNLVNDMLEISRINLGKLMLKPERVSLSQIVQETLDRNRPMIEEAQCDLRVFIEPDVWGQLDPYRIEQVITNLISNSCRYAYGKPIQIVLKKVSTSWARIEVIDQGMGIQKEDQARIFGRFERATTLNEKAGLGLGLFIVKQIVDAHLGEIRVESEPNKGAAFSVDLPLEREG